MLRALFTALASLTLLAGASACSDAVPPPGATLSGRVYYDANANGMFDSCDKVGGEQARVVAVHADGDGQRYEAPIRGGEWSLAEVASDDYFVSLEQPATAPQLPVTQPSGGDAGDRYRVSVQGYEEIEDLHFGVFGGEIGPVETGNELPGLVFDDGDGDGAVDPGECLVGFAEVYPAMSYPFGFEPSPEVEWQVVPFLQGAGIWRVTKSAGRNLCENGVLAEDSRPEGSARIGAEMAIGPSAVSVVVFADRDGDGSRGEGERLVRDAVVYLGPKPGTCLFGGVPPQSLESGFDFRDLPAGSYIAYAYPSRAHDQGRTVDCNIYGCDAAADVLATTSETATLDLRDGEMEEFEFGFRFLERSTVRVEVIEDQDLDGQADAEEPRVPLQVVCYRDLGQVDADGLLLANGNCQQADRDGVREFSALNQRLGIGVVTTASERDRWVAGQPVEVIVGEGEEVAVTLLVRRAESGGLPGCTAVSC
jgi:hypothetical protein